MKRTPWRSSNFLKVVLAQLVLSVVVGGLPFSPAMAGEMTAQFEMDGSLSRPEGYREWIYVGTPLTPNDMNDGKAPFPEFHNVYMDPESYAVYRETGKFPDGTMFVKELVSVGSKNAASGKGYFMGEFIGLEVAHKDSSRYPKAPGYWSYYSYGHRYPLSKTSKAQPVATCNACHQGAAAEDWVFTQYYPVLRSAKRH